MEQKKQALAVVAGPYRFYQVLWLYTQFPEYEWSILLLPYGNGDKVVNDIHAKCDKLGIFKQIFHSNMIGQNSGLLKQGMMFLKMFAYYLIGKKNKFMEKIILSQTNGTEFDVFFVGCEYSIIEGAIIGLAAEKDVYIFEEGMSDYTSRKKYPAFRLKEIISFVVTKMGYFSPYECFELDNTKLCIKYSSMPNALKDRNYKKVRQLFEGKEEEYRKILETIYAIDYTMMKKYDVILFTTVSDESVERDKKYIQDVHDWLGQKYKGKKVLIKKHPRDRALYNWKDLECECTMEEIPAEVIIQYITNQKVILLKTSTLLISLLKRTSDVYMLFPDAEEVKIKSKAEIIQILDFDKERIICL